MAVKITPPDPLATPGPVLRFDAPEFRVLTTKDPEFAGSAWASVEPPLALKVRHVGTAEIAQLVVAATTVNKETGKPEFDGAAYSKLFFFAALEAWNCVDAAGKPVPCDDAQKEAVYKADTIIVNAVQAVGVQSSLRPFAPEPVAAALVKN